MALGTETSKGRRCVRGMAIALTLAVAVPLGLAPTAQAEGKGLGRPDLPEQQVSKVRGVGGPGDKKARTKVAKDKRVNARWADNARAEQEAAWPKPGAAELRLKAEGEPEQKVGGLPVGLSAATGKGALDDGSTARITVLGQKAVEKAGITGVLFTATSDTAGKARLTIDYSGFASAVGGDWASRLQLVQLPACAVRTPAKAECRTKDPLKAHNDVAGQSLEALVSLAGAGRGGTTQPGKTDAAAMTVFAVTATLDGAGAAPSGTGDYTATGLSPSSAWESGGNSGTFGWDYDFTVPSAAAGPEPELSLSYDSGSIDGQTATTNNQGSAVGEGFSVSESYIERTYGSCDDDGHKDVFDRCWKYDNARLVLNGKATRLVKDSGTWASTWRLAGDDASTVKRSTGAGNGDDNGEHWTVTTGDGTQYVFGVNKLDGATDQRTNSTWTVPVYGDDSGEPGYSSGDAFADRSVSQAWRWNLDYVVDTRGNAATYWYAKETNHYKKNKATAANASYTRGGYLKEIKYGLRKGALFTDDADAKVVFRHAERCTASDCSSLTKDTADNWPDVPFDAICSDGDSDCLSASPSFFSRKRLTDIDTYSWSAADSGYKAVDSWKLTQEYLDGGDIGDTSDHVLTLKSVKRTGKTGDTDIAMSPVSFTYQMRPNRVDATDDILPLTRPRISTITSETGAITTVTLSSPECVRSQVIDAPEDTNTRNCYPQYWNINGVAEASVDWFHKYRVTAIVESDPAGHNDAVEHSYVYEGAAWRHNDNPFMPEAERTWSDWRGYRKVTTYRGATNTTRSKSISLYMQGMDGDKKKDGTNRSVTIAPLATPDLGIAGISDRDQYAGQLRQQVTYDGSVPVTSVVNDPWSTETARQSVPGARDHVARYIRTGRTATYTHMTVAKTWRSRVVATTYDAYGMPVTVDDSGEAGKGGDQTCTRNWYARNTDAGITNPISRTRTVGRSCSVRDAALDLPDDTETRGDVLSDTAFLYDTTSATTWTESQKPETGEVTWTGRPTGYASSAGSDGLRPASAWQTVSTTSYDVLGRVVSTTDAAGSSTSTAYTPTGAGPLTKTITTNAKGHRSVAFLDPRRGVTTRAYDANLKKTEMTYDALGRLTGVWLPNRNRAGGYSANSTFDYQLSAAKPSWVSTSSLKKDGETYNTSYALYDALLRPLQTQSPTPQGGRLLTDTRYDSRGLAYESYADIFDTASTPDGTYARAEYGEAPQQTETVFDGAERPVSSTLYTGGVKKWSTTTTYTGDSTATSALEGGSATRTVTDVRGRTVESREYAGQEPSDTQFGDSPGVPYTSTRFEYALDGKQTAITGPDDAEWAFAYDLFGRMTKSHDPDKGTTTLAYNVLDQQTKTTDSRGKSVLSEYDVLGRPTRTWAGSKSDADQLTAHTYDTPLKGRPGASTRYVGGKSGKAYTQTVVSYDSLSRPTATQLQLPSTDPLVEAGAPSTIELSSYYNIDGTLQNAEEPALGGLPSEIVDYGYNTLGQVTSIGGSTGYLLGAEYSALGQALQLTLGTANSETHKKAYVTNRYEEGTGRLTRSHVTDQTHGYMLQDLNYTYDDAGNVTRISDPTTLGGTSAPDTQCFTYDGHRRLVEAWTPASQSCEDDRSASDLTGPAPYWTSYTYNEAGQRATETRHTSSGDTKATYCYDSEQPHTLTSTSLRPDCSAPDRTYEYDTAGHTTSRPGPKASQDLLWSEEGQLSKVTEGGKSTDYIYDAGGELLIRSTEGGERVLYVGRTELHLRADGTAWAQRHYGSGDITVAVRSNEGGENELAYLVGDHHSTSTLALDATDQSYTKRYFTPFGKARGNAVGSGTWPDDKGFLGKTEDPGTGLTHLGARQYDAEIGQFTSVDPVLQAELPQTLNGYSYGAQNPVTQADPTGMALPECNAGLIRCRGGLPEKPRKRPNTAVSGGNPGSPGNSGSYVPWTPGSKKRILADPSKGRYNIYGPRGRNSYGPNSVYTQNQWNADHARAQRLQAQEDARKQSRADGQRSQADRDSWVNAVSWVISRSDDFLNEELLASTGEHLASHWRDYVNAVIIVGGFLAGAACGATVVCGVAVAFGVGASTYAVSNAGTGKWDWASFGIQTVGSGVGGGVAARFAGPKFEAAASWLRTRVAFWKLERNLDKMRRDIYGS